MDKAAGRSVTRGSLADSHRQGHFDVFREWVFPRFVKVRQGNGRAKGPKNGRSSRFPSTTGPSVLSRRPKELEGVPEEKKNRPRCGVLHSEDPGSVIFLRSTGKIFIPLKSARWTSSPTKNEVHHFGSPIKYTLFWKNPRSPPPPRHGFPRFPAGGGFRNSHVRPFQSKLSLSRSMFKGKHASILQFTHSLSGWTSKFW